MNSFIKLIIIGTCFVLTGFTAQADTSDYLSVVFDYSKGNFSNFAIFQTIGDTSQNAQHGAGTYELRLVDNNQIMSQNFFELTESQIKEVLIGHASGSETFAEASTYTTNYQTVRVPILLATNINQSVAKIEIYKGNQLLAIQLLSDIPTTVNVAGTNKIIIDTPQPSFPPFAPDMVPSRGNMWLWIVLGIAGLAVMSAGAYIFVRRSRNLQAQPPSDIPPTLPTIPPVPPTT